MQNNERFFDSEVVLNHPQTAILVEVARQRQRNIKKFLALCLLGLMAEVFLCFSADESVGAVYNHIGNYYLIVSMTVFAVVYTINNLMRWTRGTVARDFLVWKEPVPRLDGIVEVLRCIGKMYLYPEQPELVGHIFEMTREEFLWSGYERSYWMTGQFLNFETSLENEKLKTDTMKLYRISAIKAERDALEAKLKHLQDAGLLPQEHGIGYFVQEVKSHSRS